jgi:hypothetical protein
MSEAKWRLPNGISIDRLLNIIFADAGLTAQMISAGRQDVYNNRTSGGVYSRSKCVCVIICWKRCNSFGDNCSYTDLVTGGTKLLMAR